MKTSEALKICHEVTKGFCILNIKQAVGDDGVLDTLHFSIYGSGEQVGAFSLEEAVQKFVAYHKKSSVEPVKDLESESL